MTTRNLRNQPSSSAAAATSNPSATSSTTAPSAARRLFSRYAAPPTTTTYQDATAVTAPSIFNAAAMYGPESAMGYLRTDGASASAAFAAQSGYTITGSGRAHHTRTTRAQQASRISEEPRPNDQMLPPPRPIFRPQVHTDPDAETYAPNALNPDDEILIPSASAQHDLEALVVGLEREKARSAADEDIGGGDADDEDGGAMEDEDDGAVVDPRMVETWKGVGGRGKVDLGEFRAALHTSLLYSVASLERDKWMFEKEEESEGSN